MAAEYLVLTIQLHDRRYHGMAAGRAEWPPSPARVFQALVAGSARGNLISDESARALRWLERLPAPTIAAPKAKLGAAIALFVPNNDTDARDASEIRTPKTV